MEYGSFLHQVFPSAKFLFLLKDNSHYLSQDYLLLNETEFDKAFEEWEKTVVGFKHNCDLIGKNHCLKINVDLLFANPLLEFKTVMNFLDLSWTNQMESYLKRRSPILSQDPLSSALPEKYSQKIKATIAAALDLS